MKEETYTTPPPMGKASTLASLHTNCTFSRPSKNFGCKEPPLVELELTKYVLDELHLLLRVADILLRNLIHFADHLDQKNQLRMGRTGSHIPRLEDMVKSCGVSFKISQVSYIHVQLLMYTKSCNVYDVQVCNENGRAVTGMHEWTSLAQSQNLLILQNLPDKLGDLFPEPHASNIGTLWKV